MKSFIQQFFVRPPVIFPLVACFFVFLTISEAAISFGSGEVEGLHNLRFVIMLLASLFWIWATFFKKAGAIAFVLLTVLSLALYFFVDSLVVKSIFGNLLILNIPLEEGNAVPISLSAIFAFIALFFYPKMK